MCRIDARLVWLTSCQYYARLPMQRKVSQGVGRNGVTFTVIYAL